MIKSLDPKKQYKVSGALLHLIMELGSLYDKPDLVISSGHAELGNWWEVQNKEDVRILPFTTEKCHYLIGRLVQEFGNCEWEEV